MLPLGNGYCIAEYTVDRIAEHVAGCTVDCIVDCIARCMVGCIAHCTVHLAAEGMLQSSLIERQRAGQHRPAQEDREPPQRVLLQALERPPWLQA